MWLGLKISLADEIDIENFETYIICWIYIYNNIFSFEMEYWWKNLLQNNWITDQMRLFTSNHWRQQMKQFILFYFHFISSCRRLMLSFTHSFIFIVLSLSIRICFAVEIVIVIDFNTSNNQPFACIEFDDKPSPHYKCISQSSD